MWGIALLCLFLCETEEERNIREDAEFAKMTGMSSTISLVAPFRSAEQFNKTDDAVLKTIYETVKSVSVDCNRAEAINRFIETEVGTESFDPDTLKTTARQTNSAARSKIWQIRSRCRSEGGTYNDVAGVNPFMTTDVKPDRVAESSSSPAVKPAPVVKKSQDVNKPVNKPVKPNNTVKKQPQRIDSTRAIAFSERG